jgi:hypothetical protein
MCNVRRTRRRAFRNGNLRRQTLRRTQGIRRSKKSQAGMKAVSKASVKLTRRSGTGLLGKSREILCNIEIFLMLPNE